MRKNATQGPFSGRPITWLMVAAPVVAVIVIQAALTILSLQVTSAARAYTTGESLWSKARHEAIFALDRYLRTGDEDYFLRYEAAIAVPLGDRMARDAIEASPPDIETATAGFLMGGNDPDDVPSLIWLMRHFRWMPFFADAISEWKMADGILDEMVELADTLRQPGADRSDPERYVTRLEQINDQITPATMRFAAHLGTGTRLIQYVLVLVNSAIAALLILLTILRTKSFVQSRRMFEAELSRRAMHDDLTGLPNRRFFEFRLGQLLAQRHERISLVILDLDQFKLVNDAGGHAAGDKLLQSAASIISKAVNGRAEVARLGGDEFGVLLGDLATGTVEHLATAIREAVESIDFLWDAKRYAVTASLGVVHLGRSCSTLEEALRAADLACYTAKEKGRNRVHVHSSGDNIQAEMERHLGWVHRLRMALEERRFHLYSQSIVCLKGSADSHMELLLRLQEGDTIVPPGAFIPAAERFGLMPQIDRFVVSTALDAIRDTGARRNVYAINLSGPTLGDTGFLPFLQHELDRTGVAPQSLCFEITETSAIDNLDAAIMFMNTMRERGCRFALDDFGVGMSSLNYLKRLPIDFLKIDGSFVRDMLGDPQSHAMVKMINEVAHIAGLKTIAEFAENETIIAALTDLGVDYAQGYAIQRPVPFGVQEQALRAIA